MDPVQETVTDAIRTALAVQGMSQGALGEPLGLGRTAVMARFSGRTNWTLQDLVRVGNALEVPPWLFMQGRQHVLERLSQGA